MLEIHFTSDDLGRTVVAPVPDMMWEAVNGVQLLQHRQGPLAFDSWRQEVRETTARAGGKTAVRTFATLAPYANFFPDFLTPSESHDKIDTAVDAVLSTPRRQLRTELSQLAATQQLPAWTSQIAMGAAAALRRFGMAIHRFHDIAIKPYLSHITTELNTEWSRRAQITARGGAEALLASFRPLMTWDPPVLTVPYPHRKTLHLDGRGLRLVPSFFCWRHPVALADPDLPPTLVYPIEHRPGWPHPRHDGPSGIGALIGLTRAAVLEAMVGGRTTTQAARLTGISPATATHHANVLREANLITSRRDANTVVHTTTPLGVALLEGHMS